MLIVNPAVSKIFQSKIVSLVRFGIFGPGLVVGVRLVALSAQLLQKVDCLVRLLLRICNIEDFAHIFGIRENYKFGPYVALTRALLNKEVEFTQPRDHPTLVNYA